MSRRIAGIVCLVAGIGMLLAGLAWSRVFGPETYWSPAQQQEFAKAASALKKAVYRPGRRADQPPDEQLMAAQARFDAIQADLDRAIATRNYGGMLLGAGGVALASLGLWLILIDHESGPAEKSFRIMPANSVHPPHGGHRKL